MLYDFQKILLSLYTNEKFLASFVKDREGTIAEFDLTAKEKIALSDLPLEQIAEFQKELVVKRLEICRRALDMGNMLSLVAFWKGTPAIMWGATSASRTAEISEGGARIIRALYAAKS